MSVAAVVGAALCGRCETVAFSPHASDPDNVITNDVHYAKPIAEITKTDEVRYWGEDNSITINVPLDVPISPHFNAVEISDAQESEAMMSAENIRRIIANHEPIFASLM